MIRNLERILTGRRRGGALLLAAGLMLGSGDRAAARNILLAPTGTPNDYAEARAALGRLSPGDTLIFDSGRYDWSANASDSLAASGVPGGLAITVDRLTLIGRPGAILNGALDANGNPLKVVPGTNAAFRNAPGADNIAIKGLTLANFENGIVLIQSDTLNTAKPVTAFKEGTRGWRLENLTFRDCYFGVVASGRHEDLAVRRSIFHMKLWNESKSRVGSIAVSVRPLPPLYRGLPYKIEIDENEIHGPADPSADAAISGIVVTADSARVTRNAIDAYRVGIVCEGKGLVVGRNVITGGTIGIVAWNTGVLGTQTTGGYLVNNEISGMNRQPCGFLNGFQGSAILLAGMSRSDISGNRMKNNVSADIVIGGIRTTLPSVKNRIHDNTGTVLLSTQSKRDNTVTGSRLIVREMKKPGADDPAKKATTTPPAPATGGKKPPAATPPKGSGGRR